MPNVREKTRMNDKWQMSYKQKEMENEKGNEMVQESRKIMCICNSHLCTSR